MCMFDPLSMTLGQRVKRCIACVSIRTTIIYRAKVFYRRLYHVECIKTPNKMTTVDAVLTEQRHSNLSRRTASATKHNSGMTRDLIRTMCEII